MKEREKGNDINKDIIAKDYDHSILIVVLYEKRFFNIINLNSMQFCMDFFFE